MFYQLTEREKYLGKEIVDAAYIHKSLGPGNVALIKDGIKRFIV